MSDLINRLKEGCIHTPKRWSGDCGEMSTIDEAATDALLQEAATELTALRSAQMTEEKAREVLGDRYHPIIVQGGGALEDEFDRIEWPHDGTYPDRVNICGEQFTAEQLKVLAWWMDNMGGER